MNIKEELDSLREAVEGCTLVAFADIGAQLVLVSSSEARASRELLDALCAEASALFAAADSRGESGGLFGADTAMEATETDLRLFLRDAVGHTDVLCCVCRPDTNLGDLLEVAQKTIPKIFDSGDSQ